MATKIILQGKINDCTLIKLGGSWAVALSKDKLEKAGFKLGMPVDVVLNVKAHSLEPIVDYEMQIDELEEFLEKYEYSDIEEINGWCAEYFLKEYNPAESESKFREDIKKELILQLKFMKKHQEGLENCRYATKEEVEDAFDYDKQGEKLLE